MFNTRCRWHQLECMSYKWKYDKKENTFLVIHKRYARVLVLHNNLMKKSRYIYFYQKCKLSVMGLVRFKTINIHANLLKDFVKMM